jgi:WD40 repeat protein
MRLKPRLALALTGLLLVLGSAGLYWSFTADGDESKELGPVYAVAFCPDGERLVTANHDSTARLWDARSGEMLRAFGRQRSAVTAVAVSPDGRRLLTNLNDGWDENCGMVLWDLEGGSELCRFVGHAGTVNAAAFTPDGRRVVSASSDKTVRVWDAERGGELLRLGGHDGRVNRVAVSPDGR